MPLRADFPELSCFTLKLHPIQHPFQCSWDTNPCHRSYHRPRMSIKKAALHLASFFKGPLWLLMCRGTLLRKPSHFALPIVCVTGICHREVKESPGKTMLTATISSELRFSIFFQKLHCHAAASQKRRPGASYQSAIYTFFFFHFSIVLSITPSLRLIYFPAVADSSLPERRCLSQCV